MKVAAFAFWDLGIQYLKILLEAKHEIVAVVTLAAGPKGFPPDFSVERFADDHFLPVLKPSLDKINTPEFIKVLRRASPDLILACYFPKIFSRDILNIPSLGCVNTHPSILPKDRGLYPVFMPVVRQDNIAGTTIHFLDPGIDTGDIIAQRTFTLEKRETGFSITQKLCSTAAEMLKEMLPLIEKGEAPRRPQNPEEAGYFRWKPEVHARIQWTKTTGEIDALIRAIGRLYGGAYSFLGKRKVLFHAACPATEFGTVTQDWAIPGQVIARSGSGYLVKTGDGVIEIQDLVYEDELTPYIDETVNSLKLNIVFS